MERQLEEFQGKLTNTQLIRAGGYFVWAAQPVYKHEEVLEEQWKGIIQLDFHS